jgi:ADP-ribosylglycohydrolase
MVATEESPSLRDRYRGCLLGGAVGDALGAPVEFLSRDEILRRFGPGGIDTFAPAYGRLGAITDDTQMTLFTADGLLRASVRRQLGHAVDEVAATASAYLRWLRTQGETPRDEAEPHVGNPGWLWQQRELHSRRGPGITCLDSLRTLTSPAARAANDRKGCGGVMRVAPVALLAHRKVDSDNSLEEAFRLGSATAAITHGHPSGYLAAGAGSVLIKSLLEGSSLEESLSRTRAMLRDHEGHEETLAALELADRLARSSLPPAMAIAELGGGWVAEEALSISVYCAAVARDFREGVRLAVNHDGDSDSTGAITGNLLGAMLGAAAIPHDWLEPLELREVIAGIADDLHDFPSWTTTADAADGRIARRVREKYPWP